MVPPSFQAALGGGIATFTGFVAFGFFHPVVLLALAVGAAYLASELAGDVEDGLVDLLAARPVSRVIMVARSALAPAIAATAIIALMLAANRAATLLYPPAGVATPRLVRSSWLAANLLAVTWSCGAIGLAVAAVARKRATAAGSAALTCISLYLLNFAATWWAAARPFARLAPFHYFDALPIVLGTHDPTRDILVLRCRQRVCWWRVACATVRTRRRSARSAPRSGAVRSHLRRRRAPLQGRQSTPRIIAPRETR